MTFQQAVILPAAYPDLPKAYIPLEAPALKTSFSFDSSPISRSQPHSLAHLLYSSYITSEALFNPLCQILNMYDPLDSDCDDLEGYFSSDDESTGTPGISLTDIDLVITRFKNLELSSQASSQLEAGSGKFPSINTCNDDIWLAHMPHFLDLNKRHIVQPERYITENPPRHSSYSPSNLGSSVGRWGPCPGRCLWAPGHAPSVHHDQRTVRECPSSLSVVSATPVSATLGCVPFLPVGDEDISYRRSMLPCTVRRYMLKTWQVCLLNQQSWQLTRGSRSHH